MVHPQLLDVVIMDFSILGFKFMALPPWTFPPVCICLFLLKLVKDSYSFSEFCFSGLEHEWVHTLAIPIYANGSKSNEGVGCAGVFPDFDMFISSCSCFDLYSTIICYFPCLFLIFHSMTVIILSFILTPEVPCKTLRAFINVIP